jgi:hypothetical protein
MGGGGGWSQKNDSEMCGLLQIYSLYLKSDPYRDIAAGVYQSLKTGDTVLSVSHVGIFHPAL